MTRELPKISVITPSFNQGRFIEQTILSVISQGYPDLEFIILDGGSTDETATVIKKYESHITYWHSRKDNGQAAAINEGFEMATGDILCWLNSDDMYLPGILHKIADSFHDIHSAEIVFGNCIHFNELSKKTRGSDVLRSHENFRLSLCDYIIQPSSFFTRSAWQKTGKLNESLHFSFDWEWFIRLEKAGVHFIPVPDYISLYRIHEAHKSGTGSGKRVEELKQIADTYNERRLAKAFSRWMDMYAKHDFLSRTIDAGQRFDLPFVNAVFRHLFFSDLKKKEYLNIIAMN